MSDELGQIAIVHDYLNQRGGAERVVMEMSDMWPLAPVYTSLYRRDSTFERFASRDVRTTPLQRLPVDQYFRALFPIYPLAFRALGEIDADVVISSSTGWAHAVRTSERALHVVYCHSPARWLWGEYLAAPTGRMLLEPMIGAWRRWDAGAARRPDLYIANSLDTQRRIATAYGREAEVVYPPVNVERFTPSPRGDRLLTVARLVGHKRIDLLVDAANRAGLGLDVVGSGPALADLRERAGPTVVFHGDLDDDAVTQLFERCRAYCIPGSEEFGIAPVEAQAAGKPVIAFARGGALETVEENVSGVFFKRQDVDSLLDALRRSENLDTPPEQIAALAARFSAEYFREALTEAISRSASRRRAGLARVLPGLRHAQ
jgi:glycosyltransferase involved in cell wall biosynthesis